MSLIKKLRLNLILAIFFAWLGYYWEVNKWTEFNFALFCNGWITYNLIHITFVHFKDKKKKVE